MRLATKCSTSGPPSTTWLLGDQLACSGEEDRHDAAVPKLATPILPLTEQNWWYPQLLAHAVSRSVMPPDDNNASTDRLAYRDTGLRC
jgi:hypothetical protein